MVGFAQLDVRIRKGVLGLTGQHGQQIGELDADAVTAAARQVEAQDIVIIRGRFPEQADFLVVEVKFAAKFGDADAGRFGGFAVAADDLFCLGVILDDQVPVF